MNKRKLEVSMMVGALLLLVIGLPTGLWMANGVNSWLSGTDTYAQVENTTAFYDGPILDDNVEHRYASVNGTVETEETPTWDVTLEWDSVTLGSTGTDNKVVFNWNVSVDDIINSKFTGLRLKLNCSKRLTVLVNAVKWDGVSLTSVEAYSNAHIDNESSTVHWNITPMGILAIKNDLNPDATDVVWFQIILEGYDTAKLTTGDTIQFQFATSESGNVYSFTNYQILSFSAVIFGIIFGLIGLASTKYWNPLGPEKKSRKRSGRKKSRARRS